ncbi:MAG TPA: phosphatidate cytidylyltransferase [Actinomycetota bacterium]|nr:phosphatidate cytidylyltransferase [Actinomycetota bacterium]
METPPDAATRPPGDVAARSLPVAVATALILVAILVTAIVLGKDALFGVALLVVMLALYELLDALTRAGRRPNIVVGLLGGLGVIVFSYLREPRFVIATLVVAGVIAFVLALRPNRGPTPVSDVGWMLLGIMWIGGGGGAAVSILTLSGDGVLLLLSLVLVAALDDIGAYLVGTNLGHHKMAPSISPGKSWEGMIGGSVVAIGAGVLVGVIMYDISILDGIALGVICALFVPVGDLFESLAKREIGIKDSGRLLPGHGGFLDRLDAIIMCAPFFFLYLRFVVYR